MKELVGGVAGGTLSLVGLRRASASHGRPAGATCIRNEHCASGICDPQTRRCPCPGGTSVCPGTGACVPACTDDQVFNAQTCTCECVEQTCCSCQNTSNPFCSTTFTDAEACFNACFQAGGTSAVFHGLPGQASSCTATGTCSLTCI